MMKPAPFALVVTSFFFAHYANSQSVSDTKWELPQPPADIAKLIKLTKPKFEFYDASSKPRQWPGLTHFDVKLDYRSVNQHRFVGSVSGTVLQVQPQFRAVNLHTTHRIELPKSYQTDNFWDRPLVLHEIDHLKLSSHPYWEKAFKARVLKIKTLSQEWPPSLPQNQADNVARKMVDTAVRKEFDAILQLLEIRYQELDRLTNHGLKPLPDNYWEEAIPTGEP